MTREKLLKNAKPILFDTEMVKAILDERKTQTRRVVSDSNCIISHVFKNDTLYLHDNNGNNYHYSSKYKKGDILYVRETFQEVISKEDHDNLQPIFKADYPMHWTATDAIYGDIETDTEIPWKPSVHMPKKYARIFLEVTSVRVERLQDIDKDGMLKEGYLPFFENKNPLNWFINKWNSTAKDGYKYKDNPFLEVVEFKRVDYDT